MNELQYKEFGLIAQQCGGDDRRYRSINVASKVRRDAVLAAWRELERLRGVNNDLLAKSLALANEVRAALTLLNETTAGEPLGWTNIDCLKRHLERMDAAIAKAQPD